MSFLTRSLILFVWLSMASVASAETVNDETAADKKDNTCPVTIPPWYAGSANLPEPENAAALRTLAGANFESPVYGSRTKEADISWHWRFGDWSPDKKEKQDSSNPLIDFLKTLSPWLGTFSQVLVWATLILGLFWLWKNRDLFRNRASRRGDSEFVAGIDLAPLLTPASLPDDVIGAAKSLWAGGHGRDALSLLYRAALNRLGERYAVPILASDTEDECVQRVSRRADIDTATAFRRIVQAWVRCAWADSMPADIESLIADFRRVAQPVAPGTAGGVVAGGAVESGGTAS